MKAQAPTLLFNKKRIIEHLALKTNLKNFYQDASDITLENTKPPKPQKNKTKNKSSYAKQLIETISLVTQEHIREIDKIGCQLSGGLDSSLITKIVSNQSRNFKKEIHCFSQVPNNEFSFPSRKKVNQSDLTLIKLVKENIDNATLELITPEKHVVTFEKSASFCYKNKLTPIRNPLNLGWITGIYERARILGINKIFVANFGNASISWPGKNKSLISTIKHHKRFLSALHKNYILRQNWWNKEFLIQNKAKKSYNISPPFFISAKKFSHKKHVEKTLITAQYGTRVFKALEKEYGIETVDPTQDSRVIKFCLNLPNSAYYRENQSRLLARDAMKGLLPDEVRLNTQHGEQHAAWFYELQPLASYYQYLTKQFKRIDAISELIDLRQVEELLAELKDCDPWQHSAYDLISKYRCKLARALHVAEWMYLHFDDSHTNDFP